MRRHELTSPVRSIDARHLHHSYDIANSCTMKWYQYQQRGCQSSEENSQHSHSHQNADSHLCSCVHLNVPHEHCWQKSQYEVSKCVGGFITVNIGMTHSFRDRSLPPTHAPVMDCVFASQQVPVESGSHPFLIGVHAAKTNTRLITNNTSIQTMTE